MIHVLTVHWKDDYWIDIQSKYLRKNIKGKYRVYSTLTSDIFEQNKHKFFFANCDDCPSHSDKLDNLVDNICQVGKNDIVMFIDGDAFPISPRIIPKIRRELKRVPLVAVQRKENLGDIQPHPCFAMTLLRFWKRHNCTWTKIGHRWKNSTGKWVSDVGGKLLKILNKNDIQWYPMLRSNGNTPHPLFFGIYDNMLYHHGAGFRKKGTRLEFYYKRMKKDNWNVNQLNRDVLNSIETDEMFWKKLL